MTIAEAMIAEFTHESQGTRKMLERLPEDKFAWKPHPKSKSLGELANHIANIPHWAGTIVNDEQFDMTNADFNIEQRTSRQAVLDFFDENVEHFKETLGGKSDEHLFKTWKLINEGQVMVEMPRMACLRAFILSHVIHHRGQMCVYLRENDVPLPALYGPTADESL